MVPVETLVLRVHDGPLEHGEIADGETGVPPRDPTRERASESTPDVDGLHIQAAANSPMTAMATTDPTNASHRPSFRRSRRRD